MNPKHSLLAGLALVSITSLPTLHAQVITGFETTSGYTDGASVVGITDTSTSFHPTWTSTFNPPIASSANPSSGALALRIQRTGATSGASGATINLAGSGVDFSSSPVKLSFSMAITDFSAGTSNQMQVLFGSNTINPGGAKYWTGLVFDNGSLYLYKANTGATNVAVSLGTYATYSNLGQYIDFAITFDPATKQYSNVTLSGSKSSADLTSAFAGVTLPWQSGTAGDPAFVLTLVGGSNDVITADFDNLSLTNIPEPSAFAFCAGSAVLAVVGLGRRRHRHAEKS